MIDSEDLTNVISVMETHLVDLSDNEIGAYKAGSYFMPNKYRNGTSYLEVYLFILERALDILNAGLDYTDFDITSEDLVVIINNANELMFYYE